MRGLRLVLVVGLSVLFLAAGTAAAQEQAKRIAFLDLSKIFDEYGRTKEYDSQLEADYKAYEKERNEKVEKLQEAQGKLALMKEEEKEKLQQDIEQMKQEMIAFDQAKRTDLSKQRDEKIREVLLEIEKTVSDFAKKEKYDLIFNDRVMVYGNESMDVTTPVLTILNENYNKAKK